MQKDAVTKNIHGKVEEWDRKFDKGIAPTPWKADACGRVTDALGRILFTPELASVSQGFVESNIDNAELVCNLVNNFGKCGQGCGLQWLQSIVVRWADRQFPNRVPSMALLKMFSEIGEVIDAPSDPMEWADVLILFLDVAKLSGVSGDQLTAAFLRKMEINEGRRWNDENGLGVISHIKEPTKPQQMDLFNDLNIEVEK